MTIINPIAVPNPINPATAVVPVPREGREHDLRVDQIVQASVAEGGLEKVLLELGYRRFWADTRVPLKTGQKLALQVMETSPRLELRIVADPLLERLGQVLHLLGQKLDVAALLQVMVKPGPGQPASPALPAAEAFREALARLGGEDGGGPWRQLLQLFLQRLGLDLESLLSRGQGQEALLTLKAVLLEAAAAKGESRPELADQAQRLVQALELFQLCNLRLAQQGSWVLPLPLPFLEEGFLLVDGRRPGRDGEEEGPFLLSLHLRLQQLGALRVDFLQDAQGVSLRFLCETPETASFMAECQEDLRRGLEGVPLAGLVFAAGAQAPVKALLQRVLPGEGMLDARI